MTQRGSEGPLRSIEGYLVVRPSLSVGIHVSPPPLRLAEILERVRPGLLLLRVQL